MNAYIEFNGYLMRRDAISAVSPVVGDPLRNGNLKLFGFVVYFGQSLMTYTNENQAETRLMRNKLELLLVKKRK